MRSRPSRTARGPEYRDKLLAAIRALNHYRQGSDGQEILDMLTITVSPRRAARTSSSPQGGPEMTQFDWFHRSSGVAKALRQLRCNTVRLIVHTDKGRQLRSDLDMRWTDAALAGGKGEEADDPWGRDRIAGERRRERARATEERLNFLYRHVRAACQKTDLAIDKGLWEGVAPSPTPAAPKATRSCMATMPLRDPSVRAQVAAMFSSSKASP